MTDAATRPAADRSTRRAPTPAAVGAGLAVGLITAMLLRIRTTPDVDLWLHLRIGDLLNAGQRFGAGPDPLAALADRPYVPTQWLAQRAMAWTWSAAGMTGIQVVRLLLVLCLGAAVVAVCRLVAPTTAAGFAAAVTMFGAAAAWGERPQLLGLVLFAGVTLLWWRSTLRGAVPWAVVPLTWLWACVHGSWLLGVAAGGVLLAGAVADRRLSRRRTVQGALVLVASVVAAALTPLGTQVLTEPFTVTAMASGSVNEWARPALDNPVFVVVLLAAFVSGVGIVRSPTHRWTRLFCLLGGLALALWMVRTMAFGSVLIAPALAAALSRRSRAGRGRSAGRQKRGSCGRLLPRSPSPSGAGTSPERPSALRSPRALSAALAATSPAAPLAVDGHAVGWAQWAHRDRRPLHDLRAEVYSEQVSTAYLSFADAEPGWEAYAARHGIATILAQRDSPLDRALAQAGGWALAAEDRDFRLWRATSAASAEGSA